MQNSSSTLGEIFAAKSQKVSRSRRSEEKSPKFAGIISFLTLDTLLQVGLAIGLFGVLPFGPQPALAQDEFDFGEEALQSSESELSQNGDGGFPVRFRVGLGLGYQTGGEERWIRMGPFLGADLDLNSDWGSFKGELSASMNHAHTLEEDPGSAVNRHALESEVRELYYSKSFHLVSLIAGRKIVPWGKGDFLTVLDVLTPKDETQLFFARPREARLGQDLLQASFWLAGAEWTFYFAPEPRSNSTPALGHPYRSLPEYSPEDPETDPEAAFRWSLDSDSASLGVMYGKLQNREKLIEFDLETGSLRSVVETYRFLGIEAAWALQPVLFKLELSHSEDLPLQGLQAPEFTGFGVPSEPAGSDQSGASSGFQAGPPQLEALPAVFRVERVSGVLGLDYQTADFGRWTFETSSERISGADSAQEMTERTLLAMGWNRRFWGDDLDLGAVLYAFEGLENQLIRISGALQLADHLALDSQYTYINIESDDIEYRAIEHLDRLDLTLTYGF